MGFAALYRSYGLGEAAEGGLSSLNKHHAACGLTTAYPRSDRACILVA
jgi:hypothetical protein